MVPSRRTAAVTPVTAIAWIGALVALGVQAYRVRGFWYYGTDVEATWDGVRNLWQLGDPYALVPGHSPFVYPPSAALLFFPAALVDNRVFVSAGLILTAVAAVALSCALAVLVGRRWASPLAALFLAITVLSSAGTETLGYANLTWVVAALAGWTIVAAERSRWAAVAVMTGVAVAVKPMAATLGLILLFRRRYAALAVAVAIPVVLNLATIPLLAAPLDFFVRVLPRVLSGATTGVGSNPSIWAFGIRHDLPAWLVLALRLLVLLGTAVVVGVAAWRRSPAHLCVIGLGAAAGLMLVVQVNQPSYGLVLLPLAASLYAVGTSVQRAVILLASAAILACGTPGWLPTDVTMIGELALLGVAGSVTFSAAAPTRLRASWRRDISGAAGDQTGRATVRR